MAALKEKLGGEAGGLLYAHMVRAALTLTLPLTLTLILTLTPAPAPALALDPILTPTLAPLQS